MSIYVYSLPVDGNVVISIVIFNKILYKNSEQIEQNQLHNIMWVHG